MRHVKMQEKDIKLNLSQRSAHVLRMGIIEHCANPHFKEKLSEKEYEILKDLRNVFQTTCSEEMSMSYQGLLVLERAFEIGLNDLDHKEFSTIVGEPFEYGKSVLNKINAFVASNRVGVLKLE